jgi:endoglucanase
MRRGVQHFQIILNLRRCPLFQFRLRPFDRVMYCSGVWSYIVGAVTTFTFLLIPLLTIWIGAAPPIPLRSRPPRSIGSGLG